MKSNDDILPFKVQGYFLILIFHLLTQGFNVEPYRLFTERRGPL